MTIAVYLVVKQQTKQKKNISWAKSIGSFTFAQYGRILYKINKTLFHSLTTIVVCHLNLLMYFSSQYFKQKPNKIDHLSEYIAPQMKILNVVITILVHFCSFISD